MNDILKLDKLVLFCLIFACSILIIPIDISMIILGSVVLFIINYIDKRLIVSVIIISYLTLTSDHFPSIREYLNIVSFLVLGLIFIKNTNFSYSNFPKIPKPVVFYLSFLFLVLFLAVVFSTSPLNSAFEFFRTILFFIICYFFYSFLKNESYIYVFIYSILVSFLVWGYRIIFDVIQFGFEGYFVRGLFTEKADLTGNIGYTGSTIFFISFTLLTAMLFMERYKNVYKRSLIISLIIINTVVLFFANSRGGILASVISIIFFLVYIKNQLLTKLLIATIFLIALSFIFLPDIIELLNNYLRWHTLTDRGIYWEMGVNVFKDYIYFGIGPGNFDNYFYNYASYELINYFNNPFFEIGSPHPHNFFLYFAAENGILGFFSSILFFIIFFYIAFNTMQFTKSTSYDLYIISTSITGIGIGLFVRSFFEITGFLAYGYISTDLPFWLLFAILIFLNQISEHTKNLFRSSRERIL